MKRKNKTQSKVIIKIKKSNIVGYHPGVMQANKLADRDKYAEIMKANKKYVCGINRQKKSLKLYKINENVLNRSGI